MKTISYWLELWYAHGAHFKLEIDQATYQYFCDNRSKIKSGEILSWIALKTKRVERISIEGIVRLSAYPETSSPLNETEHYEDPLN